MLKWADASKSTLKFGCPNEKVKFAQSCPTLYSPWNSPGQNTGVGRNQTGVSCIAGGLLTERSG